MEKVLCYNFCMHMNTDKKYEIEILLSNLKKNCSQHTSMDGENPSARTCIETVHFRSYAMTISRMVPPT